MDDRQTVLPLTVHLLATSGASVALQQTIDWLLHRLCPDVQLFLVSEREAPAMQYECTKKRLEFPGISVTLFLHEELGDERICQMHGFFQQPPWSPFHTELKQKKYSQFSQTVDDFYCLDPHMPVWGIRQVHYGTEIVRLTLYCSFDNYEDAVRLYEIILQMEAAAQKSGFCFFVLYSTKHISIQLSLKQLPPGISIEVKGACALQFIVHTIGQLVPLLPYPCVPISDTRWQTQDYDGNRILLLVTGNTTVTKSPSYPRSVKESLENPGTTQTFLFRRLPKTMETQDQTEEESFKSKHACNMSCNNSNQSGNLDGSRSCLKRMKMKETEINVDTGYTAVNFREQQAIDSRYSRSNHTIPQSYYLSSSAPCKVAAGFPSTHRDCPSSTADKRNKEFGMGSKVFSLERAQPHHSYSKVLEEEFFI
ncbi:protein FAM124B [Discoglossus pictus]